MYGYNNKPIHHLAHNYAGNAVALRCFSDDAVTRPCYSCNKINCCIAQQNCSNTIHLPGNLTVISCSHMKNCMRASFCNASYHLATGLADSKCMTCISLSLSLCHQTNTIILIIIVTIGQLSTRITTNKIGTTDICWHCYLVFPLRLREHIIMDL